MVTRGYWSDLRALSKRMPAAFQVLILITERMNKSNALVISQATLGQMLGYGRTTIHKATKLLEDEKWLQVVKVGTANAYIVNSKVVWRDHSGKRYGSFYAEVLVSEEEQHKTAEQLESVELRNIPVLLQGEKPILSGLPPPPPDQGLLPPDPVEFPATASRPSWRPVDSFASTSAQARSSSTPNSSARRCSHGRRQALPLPPLWVAGHHPRRRGLSAAGTP